jgi:site-specific DNA-methyltransferase (adenine-specific)
MGGKPLNVMCQIVEHYSKPHNTVLDFCMGSATTGIACIRTNRRFVGIEKDPAHFATAKARLENELKQSRFQF